MRIARDGTWFYRGSPIARPALVKLFASVLVRAPDGAFWLETPVERGRIAVDDVPFTIVEVVATGRGRERHLRMRTNLDDWVEIGPDRPLRAELTTAGTTLVYATVRAGLEARLLTAPFYALVDMALEDGETAAEPDGELAVWSGAARFVLGRAEG